MDKWEIAKLRFKSMLFPSSVFIARSKEAQAGKTMLRDERIDDMRWYGVVKNPRKHKEGKISHNGTKTSVAGLAKIEGFTVDGYQLYCYECKRVYEIGGTLLNNKENIAITKVFKKDISVNNSYDDGLNLI